jgi:hypothetical protein
MNQLNEQPKYIKNEKLGHREVKNKILKYLYTNNINLNLKHEIITGDMDLDNIRDNDYIICPRFGGTRSWIIFFHTGPYYYAVNFPKHSQKKKEDLYIHPIEMSVSKEFYKGSIMEGIYFRMDDKRYLIVDEIYLFAGENQLLKPKEDRLNMLSKCIKVGTNINDNYSMHVSQYYNIDKRSLQNLYDKIKADSKIQEIIFYPQIYGRKIYSYAIMDSDLNDNIINISNFILQKTDNPDVYNLLSVPSEKKVDIAYIPDIETSKKCKQWFKNTGKKKLLAKCQMDMGKKKWIPLELIEEDEETV